MKRRKFTVSDRLKSFRYAFNGLRQLFIEEPNSRIHLAAAICAITAGFVFKIRTTEWIAVLFAIGFVFAAELFNTSIEKFSDFVSPVKNENIKEIKDLAAAGVLVSAVTALIIGLIVFLPEILKLI
jgi:diacylglycerol kinase